MTNTTLAHVTPEVLRWARESSGYSLQDAARAIGVYAYQIQMAEEGVEYLTLRQAEGLAKLYERPLAVLFAPDAPDEEPQEVQFRRLPGSPEPPWPSAMRLLARRITARQEAAIELYEAIEETPPWLREAEHFADSDPDALPEAARNALGVSPEEQAQWADVYTPLRGWVDAVEAQGVLVMQDGSLGLGDMRGFASVEPREAPAIVVNTHDDPRARAFTVVHEFGHVVRAALGLSVGPAAEAWCNQFAAEVLMPPDWFVEEFGRSSAPTLLARVEALARTFSVTPLAAAVRVARLELAPRDEANAVIAHIERRGEGPGRPPGGGGYYLNQIVDFGPGYIRLVFDALDANAVTYPTASGLLGGVKVDNLAKLRETLARRTYAHGVRLRHQRLHQREEIPLPADDRAELVESRGGRDRRRSNCGAA